MGFTGTTRIKNMDTFRLRKKHSGDFGHKSKFYVVVSILCTMDACRPTRREENILDTTIKSRPSNKPNHKIRTQLKAISTDRNDKPTSQKKC